MTATGTSWSGASARGREGFTFVEILATMALLAIVLPTVMSGISLCLSTASLAKTEAQAASLCESKLGELVTVGPLDQDSQAGDFGADLPGYRWTAQMSDWDQAGTTGLRQLDLTVYWTFRNTERSVTLTTLVNTGVQQ